MTALDPLYSYGEPLCGGCDRIVCVCDAEERCPRCREYHRPSEDCDEAVLERASEARMAHQLREEAA